LQKILVLKLTTSFAASLAADAGVAHLPREPTERHCTRCRLSKVVAPVLAIREIQQQRVNCKTYRAKVGALDKLIADPQRNFVLK
jgi:hypothetical protein